MIERIEFLFRTSLYLLVALSSIAIGLAEGNLFPHLFTLPLIAIAYFYLDQNPILKIESILTNVLGVVALLVAFLEFRQGSVNVEMRILAASHLLAYFTWIVLLIKKRNQQYWWLLALSVLNMSISASLTNSSALGLAILAYLFLAIWTLTLFTTYRGTASLRFAANKMPIKKTEPAPSSSVSQPTGKTPKVAATKNQTRLPLAGNASKVRGGFHLDPSEKWVGYRFVAVVGFISIASMVVGMGLFTVTPRVWIGNWKFPSSVDDASDPRPFGNPVSGFTSHVKLGDIGELLQSRTPVMRISYWDHATNSPLDSSAVINRMHDTTIRLRGAALSVYQRGSWSEEATFLGNSISSYNQRLGKNTIKIEYELEPVGREMVFSHSPLNAGFLQSKNALQQTLQQNNLTGEVYIPTTDLSMFNTVKYTTFSNPPAQQDPSRFPIIQLKDKNVFVREINNSRAGNAECFQHILQTISSQLETEYQANLKIATSRNTDFSGFRTQSRNSRSRISKYDRYFRALLQIDETQLAKLIETSKQLCEKESQTLAPLERARVLQNYLRTSNQFSYTLNLSITDPTIDPVEDFLFNRKSGHCEYFASSLALMLRAVGIPSRLVTGFVEGRWDEKAKRVVIEQRHAHAWVEAFIEGRWVVLDPTPASGLANNDQLAFSDFSWDKFQAKLSTFWQTYVLGVSLAGQRDSIYDPLSKKAVSAYAQAENLREFYLNREGTGAENSAKKRHWLVDFSLFAMLLLTPVLVVLLFLYRGRVFRFLRRFFTGNSAKDQQRFILLFFKRFLDLAAKNGLKKRPEQTAREFSQLFEKKFQHQLAASSLNSLPELLTDAYYQVRFRGSEISEAEIQKWKLEIDQLSLAMQSLN